MADEMTRKYGELYTTDRNVTTDEVTTAYDGQLAFKQYLLMKRESCTAHNLYNC